MKKIIIAALSVILTVVMCLSASAEVINSNHYIEEPDGYPKFNSDESEWEVLGWTVVDTEIERLGYVLDGAEIVWVVEDIDVRANNSVIERNDCFEDLELESAVAAYGLANGLTEFFAYRVHITLDTLSMEKGEHMLEVAAEYSDGSIGNPFRGNAIEFTKTKDAVIPEESSEEESDEPEESSEEVSDEPEDSSEEESGEPEESSDEEPDEPEESDEGSSEPEESEEDTEEPVEPGDISNGDFNDDGEVNNKDVVTLFRYVSGNTENADPKYDFNGDGGVDNKDVVSLFRAVSAAG